MQTLELTFKGRVQGVGFRPLVSRLASEMQFSGYVQNTPDEAKVFLQGDQSRWPEFVNRVSRSDQKLLRVDRVEQKVIDTKSFSDFTIKPSQHISKPTSFMDMTDVAICKECSKEVFDPVHRRYMYPFTTCVDCGPRYTIQQKMPFDRENTSFAKFPMCADCKREYQDPKNRRFHAQSISCPVCGPKLCFANDKNQQVDSLLVLKEVAECLEQGQIVAMKGVGGFHLLADASNDGSVQRLRQLKSRARKPFAIMVESAEWVECHAAMSAAERESFLSEGAPIVIVPSFHCETISRWVSLELPSQGVMRAYSAQYQILLSFLQKPMVVTSANYGEAPICFQGNDSDLTILHRLADTIVTHDLAIQHPADDSVVLHSKKRRIYVRRARGFAPYQVNLSDSQRSLKKNKEHCVRAGIDAGVDFANELGSELARELTSEMGRDFRSDVGGASQTEFAMAVSGFSKMAPAIQLRDKIIIAPHFGQMRGEKEHSRFCESLKSLKQYGLQRKINQVAVDLNRTYPSTQWAENHFEKTFPVQHHLTHVFSVLAENVVDLPALAVSWDGSGLGLAGEVSEIWGGEFFLIEPGQIRRVASFEPFRLIGGERAVKQLKRLDVAIRGADAIEDKNDELYHQMMLKELNSPCCSSVGRLFDAMAFHLNLIEEVSFEGEAAQYLENAASAGRSASSSMGPYPKVLIEQGDILRIQHRHLFSRCNPDQVAVKALNFHKYLVESINEIAEWLKIENVILTGGCFQNRLLVDLSLERLQSMNKRVFTNLEVPPNDAGLAVGQLMAMSFRGEICV